MCQEHLGALADGVLVSHQPRVASAAEPRDEIGGLQAEEDSGCMSFKCTSERRPTGVMCDEERSGNA